MQKKRKKQAKNPFGVMKEEEEEDEKQELEFAEGFRRIKIMITRSILTNATMGKKWFKIGKIWV